MTNWSLKLSTKERYKGHKINSSPYKVASGGFSSNGSIEIHHDVDVEPIKHPTLQDELFPTETEADEFYVKAAKVFVLHS